MPYWIEVSDPASKQSVSWQAMSLTSAKYQAKLETKRGGRVRIIRGDTASSANAEVVWSSYK